MSHIEKKLSQIRQEGEEIGGQVREKIIGYIGAGFGLIASLAWNEAIKALIEYIFPLRKDTILAKFLYAAAMTLVLIFVSVYLVKILKGQDEKKEEPKASQKKK